MKAPLIIFRFSQGVVKWRNPTRLTCLDAARMLRVSYYLRRGRHSARAFSQEEGKCESGSCSLLPWACVLGCSRVVSTLSDRAGAGTRCGRPGLANRGSAERSVSRSNSVEYRETRQLSDAIDALGTRS